jgi:glucose-1-phosphate thymidylyltransferase
MKNIEVVGVIPAAGWATRMGNLPCSKEILPIGFHASESGKNAQPKVIISYMLEKMRFAGIRKVYIVLRKGKWDIPTYLGDGSAHDMHICYLMQGLPYGVPYTLDQATPFIEKSIVALGFPDTIYNTKRIYINMLERLNETDADVVLGLFPADYPQNADGVEIDSDGIIRRVIAKPHNASSKSVWAAAVWRPNFSRFMHNHIANIEPWSHEKKELQIGHIMQTAIEEGQRIAGVHVSEQPIFDVGTPDNFTTVLKRLSPDGGDVFPIRWK